MRLIDADALMETYADRMSVVADRYSPDSSECGILCGAMKLLSIQPTIEPDPDTVSRQAARDAVCEELDSIDHVPQWVFDRLTKKIENLPPSPTPSRPQWIPCSERLPEKGGDYLTTLTDKDGNYVDVTEWQNIIGGRWIAPLDECDYCEIGNVIAWMPLPEPYAERRTDDESI